MRRMDTRCGRWSRKATVMLPVALLLLMVATVVPAQQEAVNSELSFGTSVDRPTRTLDGGAETFGTDVGKVFCMARVVGVEPPAEITFAWYHEGKTMARVPLTVRSSNYRTWSSKNIMPAWTGAWEVKLLDETGRVLATGSFTVE